MIQLTHIPVSIIHVSYIRTLYGLIYTTLDDESAEAPTLYLVLFSFFLKFSWCDLQVIIRTCRSWNAGPSTTFSSSVEVTSGEDTRRRLTANVFKRSGGAWLTSGATLSFFAENLGFWKWKSVFCMGNSLGIYVTHSSYRDDEEFLTGSH